MRLTSLCILFLLATPVLAQNRDATVIADSVTVRAAPKEDAPDTLTLPRGTLVLVHHDVGDWYAIQAPSGSISWINHLFLAGIDKKKPFPQNGHITADSEIKLAAGKVGVEGPLFTRLTKVVDGTIVLVLGPAVKASDGSTWYPVSSIANDFRFIPKSSVRIEGPSKTGYVVSSPPSPTTPAAAAADGSTRTAAHSSMPDSARTPAVALPPASNNPLWLQAERAEQAGQLDTAEQLYFKLAKEMNGPNGNPELANQCYTRIHALRELRRNGKGQPAGQQGVSWTTSPNPVSSAPATREPDGFREPRESASARRESSTSTSASTTSRPDWSGAGMLRVAYQRDGRQYYALEDARGRVIVYALSTRNTPLNRHVGRTVDLYGSVTYPDGKSEVGIMDVDKLQTLR